MWEYKQVVLDRNATVDQRQETLDNLGAEGWELKTQLETPNRFVVLVFARPQVQESSPGKPDPKQLLG